MINFALTKVSASFINCQQVRFARKTFRLRYAYGQNPVLNEDQLEQHQQIGSLDGLKYERIRFAHIYETCSPFYDEVFEKFVSLYEIKAHQFKKLKKQQELLESGKITEEQMEKVEMNPVEVLKQALINAEPAVVTRPVKRGGATYQVPYPLQKSQSEWYALKWIIKSVKERPKPRVKHFPESMALELLDAFYGRGKVIKRRDDMHRLADANRAFAHYRWG